MNAVLNIAFLTEHLRSTTPLTKAEVFAIAFFMNCLFLSFVFYELLWNTQTVFKAIDGLYDTIIRLAESQTRDVGKLVERVDEDKPPKKH